MAKPVPMSRQQRQIRINAVFFDKEMRDIIILRFPLIDETSVAHNLTCRRNTRQGVERPVERGEIVESSIVHHCKYWQFHRFALIILHRHAPCLLRTRQDLITLRVQHDIQLHIVERHINKINASMSSVVFNQCILEIQTAAVFLLDLVRELVNAVVQAHAFRL